MSTVAPPDGKVHPWMMFVHANVFAAVVILGIFVLVWGVPGFDQISASLFTGFVDIFYWGVSWTSVLVVLYLFFLVKVQENFIIFLRNMKFELRHSGDCL